MYGNTGKCQKASFVRIKIALSLYANTFQKKEIRKKLATMAL